MTVFYRASCILFFVLLISACAGNMGPVPEDHFYRLNTDVNFEQMINPLIPGRIGIKKVLTSGLYNERAILYLDSEYPLELHRYRYHHWQDNPTNLIQKNMHTFLRAAGVADTIFLYEPGMGADGLIVSRLSRFELEKEGIKNRVVVSLEIKLEANNDRLPAWSKEYTANVPVLGETMHDSVASFDTALQKIYGEFIDDLKEKTYRIGGID